MNNSTNDITDLDRNGDLINTFFADEFSWEIHTTINGVSEWHASDLTISDIAAARGLTVQDFVVIV